MSRPNVADWQYLGVDKFTLGLEWNCGRKARKGHICEDTFAYGSYSSKDKLHEFNIQKCGTVVTRVTRERDREGTGRIG